MGAQIKSSFSLVGQWIVVVGVNLIYVHIYVE